MMKEPQIIKIDESVKVSSWGQHYGQDYTQQAFQKYAQSPKSSPNFDAAEDVRFPSEEAQINVETGFRKLKNEQIEKLKDLRNEYQQIRKIATEYAAPRGSRTPSVHSSSRSNSEVQQQPTGRGQAQGGREVQILELEKKQLEIMVENSMKKIEELLHNEMGYKKTIHQLRLTRQNRTSTDIDQDGLAKLLKKKERDFSERVKLLELEREALLGSLASTRDRVKYLEGSLSASQQELRRLLDEKRNFEEQLRLERDKYLSLEIDLRRERRQHEISEKDKVAEINRLLKLRDVRQSTGERELRNSLANLQEQVKVKEERYRILLEKFEGYQREQRERVQREKENEARVVSELLSKSTAPDPQSKLLQQTITGILNRLTDLEKKPIVEIDNIVNHEHEVHSQTVERLQQKINQLSKLLQEKCQQVSQLEAETYQLKSLNEKVERELKRVSQREAQYAQEVDRLKKLEKSFKKDKSVERFNQFRLKSEPTSTTNAVSSDQAKLLQSKIAYLNRENESLASDKQALDEENRQLRLNISRLEFEVEKGLKEKTFQLTLQQKAYEKRIEDQTITISQLKIQLSSFKQQLDQTRSQSAKAQFLRLQQIQRLSQSLQALSRQRRSADSIMKENINNSVSQLRSQNNLKLSDLTTTIQQLTLQNQRLHQERQESLALLQENERLVEMLKRMRYINGECDRLWSSKEQEYEKIDEVLRTIRK